MTSHLLSLILFTPLAGMLLLLFIPSRQHKLIRIWANATAFVSMVLSFLMIGEYDKAAPGFQLVERASWIPSIGAQYLLGVDGISLLLAILTTVIGFLAILCSWSAIDGHREKE